jgi:hypothetical protein
VLEVSSFGQDPDDMAAFAAIYEIISKLNHMRLVGLYFGPQEDLGTMCILSAFTEDADKLARTALEDARSSDDQSSRLHVTLKAHQLAYLQPQSAKEWRRLCEDLVWPSVFSGGWTEVVCLYDLGNAIAALTADDTIYVKNLDTPLWARFLQILEDVGPAWVVAVLYYIFACCAEYHHARGPEEPPNSQLPKGRCTFQWWTRRAGARGSQMFQAWGVWSLCPGLP